MKGKNMVKKSILMILVLVLVGSLLLVACDTGDDNSGTDLEDNIEMEDEDQDIEDNLDDEGEDIEDDIEDEGQDIEDDMEDDMEDNEEDFDDNEDRDPSD